MKPSSPFRSIANTMLMLLIFAVMVLPFLWMLSTSLKEQQYILQANPQLIPNPVSVESYIQLAERIDLTRSIFNSVLVAVVTTIGQIIVSSIAAYAFARMEWRGRNTVFVLYLATMMIPSVVLVIPQFILVRSLGWVNSYAALIVPGLFSAFGTFLLRQAFLGLPKDFEEAAFVDGANGWQDHCQHRQHPRVLHRRHGRRRCRWIFHNGAGTQSRKRRQREPK